MFDYFGVKMLSPSLPDGRLWYSKWDRYGPRSWAAGGLGIKSYDPFDNESFLHSVAAENGFINRCTIDGAGIMRMEGPSPRLYVNSNNDEWLNTEITCYCQAIIAVPNAGSSIPLTLCGRTDADNSFACPCDAHGYYGVLDNTGTTKIRKELKDGIFGTDVTNPSGIHFDGVNDYLNLGVQSGLWSNTAITKFSFSFWVRPEIIYDGTNFREMAARGWGGNYGFTLYYYTTLPRLYFEVASTWPTRVSTIYAITPVDINTWYNIIVVYDSTLGSQVSKIYVNGVLDTTTATSVSSITLNNTSAMTIGGTSGGLDLKGNMKDFRWYQGVALSGAQALAIYGGSSSPTPSYKLLMNEGTGNPVDSIGALTTTLTNGADWATFPTGWVGTKLIIRNKNEDADVDIQVYQDFTNGVNGGTWIPVTNTTDAGAWGGVSLGSIQTCIDNQDEPTSLCRRPILTTTQVLRDNAKSCFLENNNWVCDYKWFSVREIKPLDYHVNVLTNPILS